MTYVGTLKANISKSIHYRYELQYNTISLNAIVECKFFFKYLNNLNKNANLTLNVIITKDGFNQH